MAKDAVLGMVLTHDCKLLIATTDTGIAFLNIDALISGKGSALLGEFSDGPNAASIYVNVTADDHFAFVSDESQNTITVVDLAKAGRNRYSISAIVGQNTRLHCSHRSDILPLLQVALFHQRDCHSILRVAQYLLTGRAFSVMSEFAASPGLHTESSTCPRPKPLLKAPSSLSSLPSVCPFDWFCRRSILRAYVSRRDEDPSAVFETVKFVSYPRLPSISLTFPSALPRSS